MALKLPPSPLPPAGQRPDHSLSPPDALPAFLSPLFCTHFPLVCLESCLLENSGPASVLAPAIFLEGLLLRLPLLHQDRGLGLTSPVSSHSLFEAIPNFLPSLPSVYLAYKGRASLWAYLSLLKTTTCLWVSGTVQLLHLVSPQAPFHSPDLRRGRT